MRRLPFLIGLILFATPVQAEVITSPSASDVSVTIYRDPNRESGNASMGWPGGYAFITETRTITLPAGTSTIRFEGVAEGLLPETAIVTGFPKGVREKNRDARLLSPAGLVDAFLKRSVTVRRTDRATGKLKEQDAIIQAGPYGGVVLTTKEGVEALGCSGLPERMLFDGVPEGLSAKPTLSVLAEAAAPTTITIQLSYLAEGFDWSANYVAQKSSTTSELALFAWLTVNNAGSQGFPDARLQVVAGQPNKEENRRPPPPAPPSLVLNCWPMDVTSTHPSFALYNLAPPPPPPPPGMMAMAPIVVTGMRREAVMQDAAMAKVEMEAVQEDLGDLKLYRVPERVTVAAKGQKQVAMINQPNVKADLIYRIDINRLNEAPSEIPIMLRAKNSKEKGLGLPLPAGRVAFFEMAMGTQQLAGEDDFSDKAIDEDIDMTVGNSPDVRATRTDMPAKAGQLNTKIKLSNAKPHPVTAELVFPYVTSSAPKGLKRGRGGWVWKGEVPANDSLDLTFALRFPKGR